MRRLTVGLFLASAAVAAAADTPPGYDPPAAEMGGRTFKTYCATCHGKTAKGDGPLAHSLRVVPADLTRIAGRNHGTFPFDKVCKIIDGREAVKGHGGSDMPVWGDAFLSSREGFDAAKVKQRIEDLARFLASIQETDT